MKPFSLISALAIVTVLYAALVTACNESIEANGPAGQTGVEKSGVEKSGVGALALNEADFEANTSSGLVLVDFWAPWCGPCRTIAPIIEEIATEYNGRAVVAKVNVDVNPGLAKKFNISSIPNLKILKDGKVVDNIVGVVPKEQIAKKLDAHL